MIRLRTVIPLLMLCCACIAAVWPAVRARQAARDLFSLVPSGLTRESVMQWARKYSAHIVSHDSILEVTYDSSNIVLSKLRLSAPTEFSAYARFEGETPTNVGLVLSDLSLLGPTTRIELCPATANRSAREIF